MDFTIDYLSEYKKQRVLEKATDMPRTTVVHNFHTKQLLIFTPLVKFYLELGIKISNISSFIQYVTKKYNKSPT